MKQNEILTIDPELLDASFEESSKPNKVDWDWAWHPQRPYSSLIAAICIVLVAYTWYAVVGFTSGWLWVHSIIFGWAGVVAAIRSKCGILVALASLAVLSPMIVFGIAGLNS